MNLLKNILKNSAQGIGLSCTIYLFAGMIFDYLNHGTMLMENWMFSRQAIGTFLVGIAFSAPTEIYNSDKVPFPLKVPLGHRLYRLCHRRIPRRLDSGTARVEELSPGCSVRPSRFSYLARLRILFLAAGKKHERQDTGKRKRKPLK